MVTTPPPHVPEPLLSLLLAGRIYREQSWSVPVLTLGEDGWPHVAIVSGFACSDSHRGHFPLHVASTTRRNIRRTGKATVIIALPGHLAYLKGAVGTWPEQLSLQYDAMAMTFTDVRLDLPPGVVLQTGIAFAPSEDASEMEERRLFLEICRRL